MGGPGASISNAAGYAPSVGAREAGAADLPGFARALSCNRDGAFCEGFNPAIKLERGQTIMQGASHCDFRYSVSGDGEASKSR